MRSVNNRRQALKLCLKTPSIREIDGDKPCFYKYTRTQAEAEAKRQEAARLRERAETAEGYYYSSIPLAEDFAEKSRVTGAKAGTLNPVYITEDQRGDWKYDFINDIGGTRDMVKALNGWTGRDGKYGDYTPYTHLTEDETGIYNYLYATRGAEAS